MPTEERDSVAITPAHRRYLMGRLRACASGIDVACTHVHRGLDGTYRHGALVFRHENWRDMTEPADACEAARLVLELRHLAFEVARLFDDRTFDLASQLPNEPVTEGG
jgi:hypothetical protein